MTVQTIRWPFVTGRLTNGTVLSQNKRNGQMNVTVLSQKNRPYCVTIKLDYCDVWNVSDLIKSMSLEVTRFFTFPAYRNLCYLGQLLAKSHEWICPISRMSFCQVWQNCLLSKKCILYKDVIAADFVDEVQVGYVL